VCCCYSNPSLEIHTVFVTSLEPPIEDEEKVDPPQNWNPMVAQPRTFVNLAPYLYSPVPAMFVHNQDGRPVMMNNEMQPQYGQPQMMPQNAQYSSN